MAMLFYFPLPLPFRRGPQRGKGSARRARQWPPAGEECAAHIPAASWGGPARSAGGRRRKGGEAACVTLAPKKPPVLSGGGAFPAHDGGALRRLRLAPCGGHKAAASGGKAPAQPGGRIQNARTPFLGPRASLRATGQLGRRWGAFAPHEEAQPSPAVGINLACLARARAIIYLIIGTE